ncbi:hypothetical protein ACFVHB_20270 [Kitasatospora sp. NPDC127111]|uniref:hypothetical protein n=1 Tax=Kitasatospora sp. NPDC127111 TaxID=3345363 RepID=UPI00362B129F
MEAATAAATHSETAILATVHLWMSWLHIGIDQALKSQAERTKMEILRDAGENYSTVLNAEFQASIVAIAASAHALDALYGSTGIPDDVRQGWKNKGTKRHGKIREALKIVFDTGPVNSSWVADFSWLFELRDFAAHAPEEAKPLAPHPIGANTSSEYVSYSTENARRAVQFALSVFRWCVDHPRQNKPDAIAWANSVRPVIEELEGLWSGGTGNGSAS